MNLALKNKSLIVPGYTHMQRAQPVLLPHLLLAYVEQVGSFSLRRRTFLILLVYYMVEEKNIWLECG